MRSVAQSRESWLPNQLEIRGRVDSVSVRQSEHDKQSEMSLRALRAELRRQQLTNCMPWALERKEGEKPSRCIRELSPGRTEILNGKRIPISLFPNIALLGRRSK